MNNYLLDKFNEIEKTHWWWEGRRELVKIILEKKRAKRILDVGCGTGETLTFLKSLFPKATCFGVDYSAKAVSYTKARGHRHVFKADAVNLPFKDNYFDVILFLDVLEHIEDDQAAIVEAKRILKKGGLIIITSPGLNFIWSQHDTGQGHKRRYTRRAIKLLATQSGLKTKLISYFNFFLSPPIIVIRLLSNLKSLKFFANYDRGVNYDIANQSFLNSLLRAIFVTEIRLMKLVRYPFGVSIVAVMKK